MIRIISTLIIGFLSHYIVAQTSGTLNYVGENFELNSELLNEVRTIQIYTPKGYNEALEKSFPVIYVLDGQEYFLHGVAYQEMLHFRDKSPDFIVVGINTDRRKRRVLFYNESETFSSFLEKELIPFVETRYRTKGAAERLYFGWEMAAGLGFELLAKKNDLFSGYILASPSHSTNKRMTAINDLKLDPVKSDKFLLVSAAPEEHWITKDTAFLSTIERKIGMKPWRFTVYDREDHYTTPLKTFHEGLSDYFSDYKPIRLRSLKAYDDYGGLAALRAYYKKRGERYGLPIGVHKETKHFLIYNAMTEDNYMRFNEYVKEFDGYIEANSRDLWLKRYADFHLKHKNVEKALYLYKFGIDKYPESTLLLEGLGDAYASIGEKDQARTIYQKALNLDPDLSDVSTKLKALNQKIKLNH